MVYSVSQHQRFRVSCDNSEEDKARNVGYVDSLREAVLGFAKILLLNAIVTEVYILLGTMIVPLNCNSYQSGEWSHRLPPIIDCLRKRDSYESCLRSVSPTQGHAMERHLL